MVNRGTNLQMRNRSGSARIGQPEGHLNGCERRVMALLTLLQV
jgi:hypothetical protein